ncbi:hypothetical protein AB0L63_16665 [Nocardia sp. NPDC051990]|uniref:hypothetical protein n=1 Tax=Nocardia sp. NPDC051990 TaxID=3155285 RepID=UPI003412060F
MTGPGEQQNQPNDAWWAQEQLQQQRPQYSQSDPTMVGQPGHQLPSQPAVPVAGPQSGAAEQQPADPTMVRQPFDQPGAAPAGYQPGTGYQQSGYHQSSPGYPQPGAPQVAGGYPQSNAPQAAPGFQQPGVPHAAPGFSQPAFEQSAPGYPQGAPGFQQPGYQQPAGFQPAPGYQQPAPGYQQRPTSGGKGWLWALAAVVATSAVWAGAMFAIGAFDAGKADISKDADLRGYKYIDNLCDITDTSLYTSAGFTLSKTDSSGDTYPKHEGSKHAAVDSMGCDIRFTPSATEKYEYAAIYTSAQVHKQTNPGPEFTASYETWTQTEYGKDAKVDKVSGLGDEAYVVTGKHRSDDPTADVSLAVRDGWTIYHISWSQYSSSTSKSPGKILSASEATEMLKKTASSTMSKLRK